VFTSVANVGAEVRDSFSLLVRCSFGKCLRANRSVTRVESDSVWFCLGPCRFGIADIYIIPLCLLRDVHVDARCKCNEIRNSAGFDGSLLHRRCNNDPRS